MAGVLEEIGQGASHLVDLVEGAAVAAGDLAARINPTVGAVVGAAEAVAAVAESTAAPGVTAPAATGGAAASGAPAPAPSPAGNAVAIAGNADAIAALHQRVLDLEARLRPLEAAPVIGPWLQRIEALEAQVAEFAVNHPLIGRAWTLLTRLFPHETR